MRVPGGTEASRLSPIGHPVEDRVRHVLLAQLAPEPFRLLCGDVKRRTVVPGAHVALADLRQLDDAAVLLDEAGGARI